MIKNLIITFLLLGAFLNLKAQDEIVTDRPDVTESSLVVPKGSVQFETGYQLTTLDGYSYFSTFDGSYGVPTTMRNHSVSSLVRIGLSKHFELRLQPGISLERYSFNSQEVKTIGLDDFTVGAKIQLFNNDKVSLAFLNMNTLPTGNMHTTAEKFTTSNLLAFSHDVKDWFSVGYNVGGAYIFDLKELTFLYSIALGRSLTDKLGIYAEIYGDVLDGDNFSNYDMGFTYLINPKLQLDLYYGFQIKKREFDSVIDANNVNILGFGFSYRLDKKKEE